MCELPTDKARRQALGKLPPSLFTTYDRILMRIESRSDEVKRLVRKALMLLVISPSMSLTEICESVSLDDNADVLEDDEIVSGEDLLRWCSSLVRTKEILDTFNAHTTGIELAHFTVREYLDSLNTRAPELEGPQLRQYTFSRQEAYELHTCIYLRFLTMDIAELGSQAHSLAQTIGGIIEKHTIRETYWQAVSRWASYLEKGMTMGDRIHRLIQKLLLHKTPGFCLWAAAYLVQFQDANLSRLCRHNPGTPGLISAAITTVLQPDFATLHMAAVLNLPEICQELLETGSSPDVCSSYGPPLHYAVCGLSIFLEAGHLSYEDLDTRVADISSTRRIRTIQILLSSGAKIKSEVQTPSRSGPLFDFVLSYPGRFSLNIEVATMLVEARIGLSDEDVSTFQRSYDSPKVFISVSSANSLEFLKKFVLALGEEDAPGTPGFIIRQKTLDVINRSWGDTGDQLVSTILEHKSTEETLAYLRSLISLNDEQGMEAFLATEDSRLVRSRGLDPTNTEYTALHIAVARKSLNIVILLLVSGVDVRATAQNEWTPVHLCDGPGSSHILLALLGHGGSALDTDSRGETIWHRAVRRNAVDVIAGLLEYGDPEAALRMVSNEGKTPMCIASPKSVTSSNVFGVLILFYESHGYFRRHDLHKYLASRESFLAIIQRSRGDMLLEALLKNTTLSKTPVGLRLLAKCFRKAMKNNDTDACEKLLQLGCPTEFDHGIGCLLTPLALAIWNNQNTMIQWLCSKKAPISTVVKHPRGQYPCTALELALERPSLNHYLPLLIEKHLEERGAFSRVQSSFLSIPILHSNIEGLFVTLEALENKKLGPEHFE